MTALHPSIADIPLPARFKALPIDARGFPVPFFVAWLDGVPDFRVIKPNGIAEAVNRHRCWICGQPLGVHLAAVIGPMCLVNRISSEPPSHRDCAEYALKACPFLARPTMHRRAAGLPAERREAPGLHLEHNPGAMLLYMAKSYKPFRPHKGNDGVLFNLGEPTELAWYVEGRQATRAEIVASIDKGLPALRALAETERDRDLAVRELDQAVGRAMALLPAA
jgi:hypothetical protein